MPSIEVIAVASTIIIPLGLFIGGCYLVQYWRRCRSDRRMYAVAKLDRAREWLLQEAR
jgi:hypothetical protein